MARVQTTFTIANGQSTSNVLTMTGSVIELLVQTPAAQDGTAGFQFSLNGGTNWTLTGAGKGTNDLVIATSRVALMRGAQWRVQTTSNQTAARTYPGGYVTDDNERTFQ